ncbi:hypothetical protein GCM10010123_41700 [Pilimelia anulata]|uniref:Uncharacterized protein n=1 Tax=Pilimelia anulata TaxID=53371 RepID=A0A8J3FC58_9ACTN|nr:helix-turn-helix transcriptional regulator [Pilimelia anulata]GGK07442.1 hypothetical protein GCM10010123_41700 [Pilimelia anulata]
MTETLARPLDRELEQVLRTGPFSVALHLAIECRGWSLERIQQELLARGIGLSLSTLSYWRRGRSRPERPISMRAVPVLEELLKLPGGSLSALLDVPRRPRGRWLDRTVPSLPPQRLWPAPEGLNRLYAQLAVPPQDHLLRVSIHDEYRLGPDRRCRSLRTRLVVLALADRVSRCRVVYWCEEPGADRPVIGRTRYCRPGRLRADPETGFSVAELVLDRVLERGEYATLDYEIVPPPSDAVIDEYVRRHALPIREYSLSVDFDQAALPARCFKVDRRSADTHADEGEELWLGTSGTAQMVTVDAPPGLAGMRWEWE